MCKFLELYVLINVKPTQLSDQMDHPPCSLGMTTRILTENSCSRESRNMYNFIAATDDNNARYRCEASNSMSPQPMKAEIVVSVLCE